MTTQHADPTDEPCGECNAEPGEPCREWCTGLAAYLEETRA